MKEKLILEELTRMREIMGFSSPSNNLINEIKTLLNEDKDPIGFFKQLTGGKWIDEATEAGIKATDDLGKQVDVIAKKAGVNTFDEFVEKIARESNTTVDELSDEAIATYIKNDPELIKVIDDFAAKVASDVYNATMSKLTKLQDVFNDMAKAVGDTRIKNIPNNTKIILSEPITSRNVNEIENLLADTKKLLDDLPTNPETEALIRQIDLKQDQITSFRNRETLSPPKPWTPKPDTPTPKQTSNVDEVLDDMVDDIITDLKSKYPDLKVKDLDEVRDTIKNMFKGAPDVDTLNKSANDIQQRIERRMKEAQQQITNAKNTKDKTRAKNRERQWAITKERFTKVTEFCTGKWRDWTDASLLRKSGIAASALGGLVLCQGLLGAGWGSLQTLLGNKNYDSNLMCQMLHMDKLFFSAVSDWACAGESWAFGGEDDEEEELVDVGPLFKACPNICADKVTDAEKQAQKAKELEQDITGKKGKTKDEATAWINTMNGPGQDLEGLTLQGWEPIENQKDMYKLTLSNGQEINVKWDGTNFVPQ